MKLFEYEAKSILAEYGISVPQGALASSPTKAKVVATQLDAPYVIKAQVLVAGRGKAGGIQFASSPEEAAGITERILDMKIKNLSVNDVWIEEKVNVQRELYFGITIDRARCCYVAVASAAGGMEIEEIADKEPEKIVKILIDPTLGFRSYHAREMARRLGYSGKSIIRLAKVFTKLYVAAMDCDAELMEMNPLVETTDGNFVAADARLIIDDNAIFRHPKYETRFLSEGQTELAPEEIEARRAGLAYVKLEGDIGIMGNGAGLVMATLDTVQHYGGSPANFLDVGGGASEEQVASALNILLTDRRASIVLINILGGITRCDNVARGILEAKKKVDFTKPMVIRLVGTNEAEGRRILTEAGIHVLDSMEEAAQMAVEIAGGR
ncbi:ADP-forming succinate--CoA ligase subunit beta [Candidatus Bathyarchaeota archaeon]|nr:MAG: ADP-forming succinate--CoA ligase subunit beta [Candidatus Bathyarchaeota archaeon]